MRAPGSPAVRRRPPWRRSARCPAPRTPSAPPPRSRAPGRRRARPACRPRSSSSTVGGGASARRARSRTSRASNERKGSKRSSTPSAPPPAARTAAGSAASGSRRPEIRPGPPRWASTTTIARLTLQAGDRRRPAAGLHHPPGRECEDGQQRERPGDARRGAARLGPVGAEDGLEAAGEQRPRRLERRRLAVEIGERSGVLEVHRFERLLETAAQARGRLAAHRRRQQGARPGLDVDRHRADREVAQHGVRSGAEGVLAEVADRGQHAGDEVGVLGLQVLGVGVRQQQAARPVDQEDLLDPVEQGVAEHDLRERHAGAPALQPPAQAARREAVLDGPVDGLHDAGHGLGDRHADRRADDRIDSGRDRLGIALHRFQEPLLDRRGQGECQVVVAAERARRSPPAGDPPAPGA